MEFTQAQIEGKIREGFRSGMDNLPEKLWTHNLGRYIRENKSAWRGLGFYYRNARAGYANIHKNLFPVFAPIMLILGIVYYLIIIIRHYIGIPKDNISTWWLGMFPNRLGLAIDLANPGGDIYFAMGTEQPTAPITMKSYTTVRGCGYGSVIDFGSNGGDQQGFDLQNKRYIKFQDLYIKNAKDGAHTDERAGIQIGPVFTGGAWSTGETSRYIIVENCHFEGCSSAIRINGGKYVLINGCMFYDGPASGDTENCFRIIDHPKTEPSNRQAEYIVISNNYIKGTNWDSILHCPSGEDENAAVRYLVFANNVIESANCMAEITGSVNHIIISNNVCSSCAANGIYFNDSAKSYDKDWEFIKISGNIIRNCGSSHYGIYVLQTRNGTLLNLLQITDNILDGGGTTLGGIYINNGGTSQQVGHMINNNMVHDFANSGIQLKFINSSIISGNLCNGNGWDGITLYDGSGASQQNVLIGNVCRMNGRDGIRIEESNYNALIGNICHSNADNYNGIYIMGANGSDRNVCVGNVCNDLQGTATQEYGINVADSDSNKNLILGNILYPNVSGTIADAGTDTVDEHNIKD
jgi:parallel beta-helix repeat protein